MQVQLYVDGACLRQPDRLQFGWAFRALDAEGVVLQEVSGSAIPAGWESGQNVAAEIQAVLEGLRFCWAIPDLTAITVYYDYEGLGAWATGRWRTKQPMTRAYVDRLRQSPVPITWQRVAGHSGHPENERVDQLAQQAARLATPVPLLAAS